MLVLKLSPYSCPSRLSFVLLGDLARIEFYQHCAISLHLFQRHRKSEVVE